MNIDPLGDSTISTASQWLHGLSARQQAISNNIANIDTPGYQRQEVPFESELRRALAGGSTSLATTDPRHVTAGAAQGSDLGLQGAQQLASQRLDGNNVSIDQEMVDLADTQMRYQAAGNAISMHLDTIRNVIRG